MQQQFHFFLLLFTTTIIYSLNATAADFPSANVSTTWINNDSMNQSYAFNNGAMVRFILFRETSGLEFGCGFICPGGSDSAASCDSFLFSIFIGDLVSYYGDPRIVWSANRDRHVRENATLEFSQNGDLVLRDFDGTKVWSTNTSGKSVVGMELNQVASLVLFDKKYNTVWSSMDYPGDSLVLGQTLRKGQRLTANVSFTNSSQGPFYLSVVSSGIQAFVGSQLYYDNANPIPNERQNEVTYVSFNNGSLDIFAGGNSWNISLPLANSSQYMQLDYGGHLSVYEQGTSGWVLLSDVLDVDLNDDKCGYPTICGEYGICSDGQCSCPGSSDGSTNYFRPVNNMKLNLGCVPVNALSCTSAKRHQFLSLINMDYFYTSYAAVYMRNTNVEACKQACLATCSCKAAIFKYDTDASSGNCYLPSELYSLKNSVPENTGYNSSTFIKVQSFPIKKVSTGVIVAACVGSLLAFFFVALYVFALVRRRYNYREVEDEDEFNMLPGLPTRFALEDLRIATNNFLRKLGEGGFGSVFEGTLVDGTKIAVKRLEGVGQGKKEFLAEVQTIGSIHHLHLVRLVGFSAEKSYRLLIYEYMVNGSLDKWIFYKDHDAILDWQTRRKIITDIAKGLTYLHEECRHKIVHLDIKPQNILLDENFNAKVSDFGLAKLIDRDQIEVMTRMRGTPGYLAPEWLTSIITEKVDVFSFGVVVLEIVCGRRNLDYSKDDESFHLIGLLQRNVAENKLVDMVDCRCTDMKVHIKDVIMIIHLAMWCLQSDSNRRPLMSVVLKVLEGSTEVETDLDYNFSNLTSYVRQNANIIASALPQPSILSGPR